jgi:hypothetical protein
MPGWTRRTRASSRLRLGLALVLLSVGALAMGGCSGASQGGPWPNAGQTRAALASKYGYTLVHGGSRWSYRNGALMIDVADHDNFVDGVSVVVYNAPYDTYVTDIDNLFAIVVPEAKSWAHQQLEQSKGTDSLSTQTVTSGGTVKFSWDRSVSVVAFSFYGNAVPRTSA